MNATTMSDALPTALRPTRLGQCALILIALTAGLNVALINPVRNYLLDFRVYYAAGRAVALGVNPYDQQAIYDAVPLPGNQPIMPYLYAPPTLAMFRAFAELPYPIVQLPWCLLQFGCAVAAFVILLRTLHCPLGSLVSVVLAWVVVQSGSFTQHFKWGQIDWLVVLLITLAWRGLVHRKQTKAGVWLALAGVTKVVPFGLLLPLIVARRWRTTFITIATGAIVIAAGWLWIGFENSKGWLAHLATQSSGMQTLTTAENMSLHALVYRAFVSFADTKVQTTAWVELGPTVARFVAWTLVVVVVAIATTWAHRMRRRVDDAMLLAAFVPVVPLIMKVTWLHHGVVLLIPFAVALVHVARRERPSSIDLLWLGAALAAYVNWPLQQFSVQLPSSYAHLVAPSMTYSALLLWGFMLWRVPQLAASSPAERPVAYDAVAPLSNVASAVGLSAS